MILFRPRFHIASFVKFTAVFGVMLALMHTSAVDLGGVVPWPVALAQPVVVAFVCALSFVAPRRTSPRCQACGRKFFSTAGHESGGLCPYCRLARVPTADRRRLEVQGLIIIAGLFFLLALALIWPFAPRLEARHGWLAAPVLTVLAFAGLCLVYFVVSVARLLAKSRLMGLPGQALKVARTCAGVPGKKVVFGSVTVHVFGHHDPTPMLEKQVDTCRSRFEALVGEPLADGTPLRILAFSRRAAFEGFCRRMLVNPGNLDGMYIPWSARTIVLTGEFPPYRLADPERIVRTLLAYFDLDRFKKCTVPVWIQAGVANLIACGGDADERARLNRKMLASLAAGTVIGPAGLFHADPRAWLRLLRDWQDLASFMKYTQLVLQSNSVVEFLAGAHAPEVRRQQFRGFLGEVKPGVAQEAVFESHFGHGYAALFEEWKAWVLDQGVGIHRPPPERVRQALLERLIPLVRDREADPLDRIHAIRDMGKAGHALGADALIEVLSSDHHVPAEEAIWSLEAISGLALGDDSRRWSDQWLAGLPEEVTGLVSSRSDDNGESGAQP
jgi:hypothetical protein